MLKTILFSSGISSSVTEKNSRYEMEIFKALQILSSESFEGIEMLFSMEHIAFAERPHLAANSF